MSPTCTICRHPDREAIDKALILGEPLRDIARRTDTDKSSLFRHKKNDIPVELVRAQETKRLASISNFAAAQESRRIANGADMLDEMNKLHVRTLRILDEVEKAKDKRTSLIAVREVRGNVELLGKLTIAMEQARREAGWGDDDESKAKSIESIMLALFGPGWREEQAERNAKIARGEPIECTQCGRMYVAKPKARLLLSADDDDGDNGDDW